MATKVENAPVAKFLSMGPDALAETCRALLTVKTSAKDATDSHKDSWKVAAKVLCAVKENLVAAQRARLVPMNRSVKEHFENFTGKKGLNISGHCYSLSDAFSVYVTSGILPENDWDLASANALETAGRIYDLVVDRGGLAHEAVEKAAAILRQRGDGYQKVLKALKESLETPKKLKEEDVRGFLLRAFGDGHAEIVACEIAAEMACMRDRDADWLRHRVFLHVTAGIENLGTPEELAAWSTTRKAPEAPKLAPDLDASHATAPAVETAKAPEPAPIEIAPASDPEPESVPVTTPPTRDEMVEWAKDHYPDDSCDENGWIEFVEGSVACFCRDHTRLPSSAEELDAYMEGAPEGSLTASSNA